MNVMINSLLLIYPFLLVIKPNIVINFLNIFLLIAVIFQIKKEGLKKSFFDKYCFLFILSIIISLIDLKNGSFENFKEIKNILKWIFIPFALGQFEIEEKTKKYLNYSAIAGVICHGINLLLKLKAKLSVTDLKNTLKLIIKNRGLLEVNLSQYSYFIGTTFLITLIITFYKKNSDRTEKMINTIYLLIAAFLMIILQTRGIYLAVAVSLAGIMLLRNKKQLIIAIIGGISLFTVLYRNYPENRVINRIGSMKNLNTDYASLARLEVFNESWRLFKENPLKGIGYGNFLEKQERKNYKMHEFYFHQHNMSLKMLSETGILGFISYLLLIGSLLIKAFKNQKNKIESLILFAFIMLLFIYEGTEILIWKNTVYPFIFFNIGVLINKNYIFNQKNIRRKNTENRSI